MDDDKINATVDTAFQAILADAIANDRCNCGKPACPVLRAYGTLLARATAVMLSQTERDLDEAEQVNAMRTASLHAADLAADMVSHLPDPHQSGIAVVKHFGAQVAKGGVYGRSHSGAMH